MLVTRCQIIFLDIPTGLNACNMTLIVDMKCPSETSVTKYFKIAPLCRDEFIYNQLVYSSGYDLFKLYVSIGRFFIQEEEQPPPFHEANVLLHRGACE